MGGLGAAAAAAGVGLAAVGGGDGGTTTTPTVPTNLFDKIEAYNNGNGITPAALTVADYEAAGVTGVNAGNLAAVNAQVLQQNPGGADTLAQVQNLVTAVNTAFDKIADYAETGTTAPATTDYVKAGVTGVTDGNLAAINSAINSQNGADNVLGNADDRGDADTAADVQTIVNAFNKVLTAADGNATDNTTGAAVPTDADYAAIGVTGVDAATAALLSDVIDGKATTDVDSVTDVQTLADAVKAVLGYDDPTVDTAPTKDQINALVNGQTVGGSTLADPVTDDALKAVQQAIDAANSDGTPIASQQELANIVKAALDAYTAAVDKIADYAETGTTAPITTDYVKAGVTGVTDGNLAAINSAINSQNGADNVLGNADDRGDADTAADVQTIVNAYAKMLAEANDVDGTSGDNTADATLSTDPLAGDYAAIGASIGEAAGDAENLALLNDIVGASQTAAVDSVGDINNLARIANAIQAVAAGGTPSPALNVADLTQMGLNTTNVTTDNLPAILAAIAAKNNDGSETDSLAKLQSIINSVDTAAPTVTTVAFVSTTGATNGWLNAGDTVSLTATFNENVFVTGSPQLQLNIGGTLVQASYMTGSGGKILTFSYTIQASQNDLDGISIDPNSLSFNTGSIKDSTGNVAVLTHIGVNATNPQDYRVDTTAPSAATLAENGSSDLADGKLNNAEATTTTFRATLPLTGSTAVAGDKIDLLLNGSAFGTAKSVTLSATDITNGYVDFTVLKADLGTDGSKSLTTQITDAAGNAGTVSSAVAFTLDTTAPTAVITDDTSGTSTGPVTYTFTFDEAVSNFAPADVTVTNGTKGPLTQVSATVYTMVITPVGGADITTMTVDITTGSFTDVAENANTVDVVANVQAIPLVGINLSRIATGVDGFAIEGAVASDRSGVSVSAAGDVNGDGYADLIIGARNVKALVGTTPVGRSYVLFGGAGINTTNLSSISAGAGSGFAIISGATDKANGDVVSAAGDINGDGLADLLVSAPESSPNGVSKAGTTYVVYGKTDNNDIDLSVVATGSGGFAIWGEAASNSLGKGVSAAGDVNGDGFADLIVSSSEYGTRPGRSYVVFGKANTSSFNLASLTTNFAGFTITGQATNDESGFSVSGGGDINGDGRSDLLINSRTGASGDRGRAYVVFGKQDTTAIDLSEISLGNGGFVVNGVAAGNDFGRAISTVGDVDGDGLADLIVGAMGWGGGSGAGRSYVVYGKAGNTAVNLSNVAAGNGGFFINGQAGDYIGVNVSAAGDINGDGLADLILGSGDASPGTPARTNAGRSYVIFGGQKFATTVDFMGDTGNNTQTGTTTAETFVGGAGNDAITGGGGADVMYGGMGNDTFVLNASNVTALENALGAGGNTGQLSRIDGGTGIDTLQLSGGANLDLTAIANVGLADAGVSGSRMAGIEVIDMRTDTAANGLTIQFKDVIDMSGMNLFNSGNTTWVSGPVLSTSIAKHQTVIYGDALDTVHIGSAMLWWDTGTVVNYAGHDLAVYNSSIVAAQLLIEQAMVTANNVVI